jgi:malonyl-CoA O-methyltransferase
MRLVQAVYPRAQVIAVQPQRMDLEKLVQARKQPWWQFWKRQQLLFSSSHDHAADMLWSNMRLHQHASPLSLMQTWSQALNAQGFVMFSCLGPDTLKELREVYRQHQWPEPHHAFTDMHDWGDMLLQAGFSQPVMDMERMTLTYQNADELLRDLRAWGRNLHPNRYAGIRTKAWQETLTQALKTTLVSKNHAGKLAVSFEIIYGHAFKATPRHAVKPLTRVELSDMKQMLRSGSTSVQNL